MSTRTSSSNGLRMNPSTPAASGGSDSDVPLSKQSRISRAGPVRVHGDRFVGHELGSAVDRVGLEHAVALEVEVDAAEHPQSIVVFDDEHRRLRLLVQRHTNIDFDD